MNNEHSGAGGAANAEAKALLRYMADHNTHHADELEELADALPEKAAAHVHEAVSLLNASTEKLRAAIGETEG